MSAKPENLAWERSSRCSDSACGEVAISGDDVYVRNSERPDEIIRLTAREWAVLKAGIVNGEF